MDIRVLSWLTVSDVSSTFHCQMVNNIRGNVTGKMIRCEFDVPMLNASMARANPDTTFSMEVLNGTFDSSGEPALELSSC